MTWKSDRTMRRLSFAGLLALIFADVLLVALAIRPQPADAAAPQPARVPIAGASPTMGATTSSTTVAVEPVREVIAASDSSHAWRAVLGTCAGNGATIAATDDGARTWSDRAAPAVALGRVQPVAGTRGFAIAAGKGCTAGEYATQDDAKSWTGPNAADGNWSRVPGGEQPALVISPKRNDAKPCGNTSVIDLARVSATQAVALCDDERIVQSTDGGSSWTRLATVAGSLSVTARDENGSPAVYVARVAKGCAGLEIARVTPDPTRVACVETHLAGVAGRVSISAVKDGGWLLVAGKTWRSGADLKTWSAT